MIQQQVREKKNTCFNAHAEEGETWLCPMYSKQTNKDVGIKKLSYVKWETKLVYLQYNKSDSQALFWCSVIILEMARHFVLMFCGTASLTLFLAYS